MVLRIEDGVEESATPRISHRKTRSRTNTYDILTNTTDDSFNKAEHSDDNDY